MNYTEYYAKRDQIRQSYEVRMPDYQSYITGRSSLMEQHRTQREELRATRKQAREQFDSEHPYTYEYEPTYVREVGRARIDHKFEVELADLSLFHNLALADYDLRYYRTKKGLEKQMEEALAVLDAEWKRIKDEAAAKAEADRQAAAEQRARDEAQWRARAEENARRNQQYREEQAAREKARRQAEEARTSTTTQQKAHKDDHNFGRYEQRTKRELTAEERKAYRAFLARFATRMHSNPDLEEAVKTVNSAYNNRSFNLTQVIQETTRQVAHLA